MRRRVLFWAAAAGFGLGGQFDSILLHRILGWHHLMTLAAPDAGALAHAQWDSAFDTGMFAILVLGLSALLIHRAALVESAARCLAGAVLAGFGLWHVLDAVLVHWLLGWHRIRPAAPTPLVWDLLWLALFGIAPLVLALPLLRGLPSDRTAACLAPTDGRAAGTAAPARRSQGTRSQRKGPPHGP